jgi:hypothetical protein
LAEKLKTDKPAAISDMEDTVNEVAVPITVNLPIIVAGGFTRENAT